MKPITVVLVTIDVPFNYVVRAIQQFTTPAEALTYINAEAAKWWQQHDGDRYLATDPEGAKANGDYWPDGKPQPFNDLTDLFEIRLWGGESTFNPVIDVDSYAKAHEAYYQREFDGKGLTRPGYLLNAYVAGGKPGGLTEAELAKYTDEQQKGLALLALHFGQPKGNC